MVKPDRRMPMMMMTLGCVCVSKHLLTAPYSGGIWECGKDCDLEIRSRSLELVWVKLKLNLLSLRLSQCKVWKILLKWGQRKGHCLFLFFCQGTGTCVKVSPKSYYMWQTNKQYYVWSEGAGTKAGIILHWELEATSKQFCCLAIILEGKVAKQHS